MKSREEVAEFLNSGKCYQEVQEMCTEWHFGKMEVRHLLDFIYEGKPKTEKENITTLE